eukprot:scaffold2443_cov114-Cylindrotheca_fusiformis.AAC.1
MMTSGAASRCPTPVQGKGDGTNHHILSRNKRNTTTTTTTREFAVIMLFFLIAASMVITSTEASSFYGCVDDDEPPGRPGSEYTCGPSTLSNGVKCDCREEDGQQWCDDSIDNYLFLDDNKTFFRWDSLGKPTAEQKEFLTVFGPLTYYYYRMCDGLFVRTTEDKANEPGTNYTKVVGYTYGADCDYSNFKEACDMEPSEAVLQFDRNCIVISWWVAWLGGRDPDPRNLCQPDMELSASPTTSMTVLQAPSVAPSGGGDGPSTTTSSAQPTTITTTTSIPVPQAAPSVAPSDEGSASGGSSSSPTTSSTSPQGQQPPSTTVQEEEEGEDDDDSSGSWSRPGLWCLLLLLLFGLAHL